jgi:hypothetical protein
MMGLPYLNVGSEGFNQALHKDEVGSVYDGRERRKNAGREDGQKEPTLREWCGYIGDEPDGQDKQDGIGDKVGFGPRSEPDCRYDAEHSLQSSKIATRCPSGHCGFASLTHSTSCAQIIVFCKTSAVHVARKKKMSQFVYLETLNKLGVMRMME